MGTGKTAQGERVGILNGAAREGFPESKGIKVEGPVEGPYPLPCSLYFFSSSLPAVVKLRDSYACTAGERELGRGCSVV